MDVEAHPRDTTIDLLASRVAALESRLDRLEAREREQEDGLRPALGGEARPRAFDGEAPAAASVPDAGAIVALIGRTLFVLAGAFLLRALTDSGQLGAGVGVVLGLAFALAWIVAADVAGSQSKGASAAFHGLASVLIAFPLIYEATTRFHFLGSESAAISLGVCTAVALAVAWRRRLPALAWIATAGGLLTAPAIALATGLLGAVTLFMVGLGVATLWCGYVLEWRSLRWPAALWADMAVLMLAFRAGSPAAVDSAEVAFGAQILLLAAYLGSVAGRTLVLNRNVIPFEVVQSIAAIAAALGGAAYLTRVVGGGGLLPGVVALTLAVGAYGAAAVFVERKQGRRRNYYFYTSAGLVLALVGTALVVPSGVAGPMYAVFGALAAWAGFRSGHVTYRAHGAAYLTVAVIATGFLPHIAYGLGLPLLGQGTLSPTMIGVLALCAISMWTLGPDARSGAFPAASHLPRLLVLVLLLGGMLALAVHWGLHPSDGTHTLGGIATVRTALLVATILALALAGRRPTFVEGRWLVYPLLAMTGLKFLLEDLRAGQSATLFVSFALYGLALVFGPRLRQRAGPLESPATPPASG